MNLSENIKNAFDVVIKTYENVDKLLKYCDSISGDCGYYVVTSRFLRYRSDLDYEGWLVNRFIKLYQQKADKELENGWRDGPVFAMEINFEGIPTVYLSKFEYDDISTWSEGISPKYYWIFSDSIDCEGNDFKEKYTDNRHRYCISEPETESIKNKYWGIKRAIYTTINLLQLDSNNISEKVFDEFNTLKNLNL